MYEDVGVSPLPIVYGWATAYHAAIESRLCCVVTNRRSAMEPARGMLRHMRSHRFSKGGSSVRDMIARPLALAASLLLALFVVACGQVSSPRGAADAQGASTPTAQAGAAAQTTSGKVTLSLAKQRYSVEEPLLVTIHNGLQTDIALADGGAGCVSIEVERLVQDSWQSVSQCAPAPAGRKSVVISAGSAFVQRIEFAHEMDNGAVAGQRAHVV